MDGVARPQAEMRCGQVLCSLACICIMYFAQCNAMQKKKSADQAQVQQSMCSEAHTMSLPVQIVVATFAVRRSPTPSDSEENSVSVL
jgi:TRAP-type C4-dicarboxylate transport system permease large subunit